MNKNRFLGLVLALAIAGTALVHFNSQAATAPPGTDTTDGVGKQFFITAVLDTLWFCDPESDGKLHDLETHAQWLEPWKGHVLVQNKDGTLSKKETVLRASRFVLASNTTFWYKYKADAGKMAMVSGLDGRATVDSSYIALSLLQGRHSAPTFKAVIEGLIDTLIVGCAANDTSKGVSVYAYPERGPFFRD